MPNTSDGRSLRLLLQSRDPRLPLVSPLPVQGGESEAVAVDREEPSDTSGLRQRDVEIMECVRMGKTNYEIGLILNISAFTVKNHLQRIFKKLGTSTRAQAVDKLGRSKTSG